MNQLRTVDDNNKSDELILLVALLVSAHRRSLAGLRAGNRGMAVATQKAGVFIDPSDRTTTLRNAPVLI